LLVPELLPVDPPVLGAELGEAGEAPLLPVELPELPVELPLEPLLMPDEPLVPPLELVLPDLKWASHSWRETWPSLFLSTDEKLGSELLLELEALGEADEPPAALDELLPFELSLEAAGDDDDELLPCLAASAATASDDRAKSAAAVVTVTVLSI
jgi:hypothetical protein